MGGVPEPLDAALAALRPLLLDLDELVRAVAAGRRRGTEPSHRRAELRPVDLKAGRRLQVVTTGEGQAPLTHNHALGGAAEAAVDALLGEPFGTWHVETMDRVLQLRVTKRGEAQVHTSRTSRRDVRPSAGHDRVKQRLLDPDDPLFDALGADADKRRQVDAFLRQLAPMVPAARAAADAAGRPLHVVDLGCGNAYLTFAAHRYLDRVTGGRARTVGIDQRPEMSARNAALAGGLGLGGLGFAAGAIEDVACPLEPVDLVLALHACDTATDDALARAVRWSAPAVLAAPCCHHDLQRQLDAHRRAGIEPPYPYQAIMRHGILGQRLADVLTDALRADVLRLLGYRVDVVEFVDSRHTPRNALIRAELTGAAADHERRAELADLAAAWQVRPRLGDLVADLLRDDA
ncbi:MAG: SAM-dependent methyltransferase [Kineosporiaceae bacterium]